jgi:isoquinoline 1-oxidoreductase alpha subunit
VGKSILTIEGLAENPDHPVFKVWLEEEVSQCGYCQPGQIMTLVALLNEKPRPTREQIIETMSTVLCRCGTYARINKAIDVLTGEDKK